MQSLKTIRAKEKSSDEAVEQMHTVVQGIQDDVKTAFGTWADTLRDQCEKTCKEAEVTAAASCLSVCRIMTPFCCVLNLKFTPRSRRRSNR